MVIGKFTDTDTQKVKRLNSYVVSNDGYKERLDVLPAEVSPSLMTQIRNEAASLGKIGRLYEFYKKQEISDGRIGGLAESLRSTVASLPLKIESRDGITESDKMLAADYASVVEQQFEILDVRSLVKELCDIVFYGARAYTAKYDFFSFPYNKTLALIDGIVPVSDSRFLMDVTPSSETYGEIKIITGNNYEGIPIKEFNAGSIFLLEDGFLKGKYDVAGIYRKLMPYYIIKTYAFMWEAQFAQNYGQPTRVARYSSALEKDELKKIEKLLSFLGTNGYALIPRNVELQLLNEAASGNITLFGDLIRKCNEEIAIVMVGQTESLGNNKMGSFARAEVLFSQIHYKIIDNMVRTVERALKKIIVEGTLAVNYPNVEKRLVPKIKLILPDPISATDKQKILNDSKIPVTVEHYSEQLNIPIPKSGDLVITNGKIIKLDNIENEFQDTQTDPATGEQRGGQTSPQNSDTEN